MVGSPTYCFLMHMGESLPINLNREENYNKVFSLSYPSKDKTIDERKLSKRILWSLRASLFKKNHNIQGFPKSCKKFVSGDMIVQHIPAHFHD